MDVGEIKRMVVGKFAASTFVYHDDIPMDSEIANFIYALNLNPNIITTNSCAGHDKFESNAAYDFVSHPYLAFIVNECGWDLFWNNILPEISSECLIHISAIPEYEKIGIVIRAHYEDKKQFWSSVQHFFLKHLHQQKTIHPCQ